MILGQISAGLKICLYDSGKGQNGNPRELSYGPDFSTYYCKALGNHVSPPNLSVPICTMAELDWMIPSLPFSSNIAHSVSQPQTHAGSLWLPWWVTYTSESCHPKPRDPNNSLESNGDIQFTILLVQQFSITVILMNCLKILIPNQKQVLEQKKFLR